MGIGLPHKLELRWNNFHSNHALGHAVLGNSDLNQDDNALRNVTIAAIPDVSGDETNYGGVSITFCFSDTNRIR